MNEDSFVKMVEDGRELIRITRSVPENKRFLLSMMLDAFVSGMEAQERLSESERLGA